MERRTRSVHVQSVVIKDVYRYEDTGLLTKQEFDNEDQYAVAVFKTTTGSSDQVTVGHVPRSISRVCWYFIQHDGEITCKVTGRRRRSDLPQGGLEVPCEYNFIGKKKHSKKNT